MRSYAVPLAALLLLPGLLSAAGPNAQTWEPNNTVRALALDGPRLFLGGDFTTLGPHTGNSALFLTTTGQRQTNFPFFEHYGGWGRCAIADGNGGWYVSSDSDTVNNPDGSPGLSGRLIHVLASGRVDTLFAPSPDGPVNGLALAGGRLYVGGGFGTIGGQPQAYLAALSPSTGALLPWNPGLDAAVNSSSLSGSLLYVGGDFSQAGGNARGRLACFDLSGASPALMPWNPGANGTVERVLATASLVYAAGAFTAAGGQARNYFAELDLSGSATTFDAQVPALPTNQGWALALDSGHLYLGGTFASAGGQPRANAACFDLPGGGLDVWTADTDTGPVEDLLRDDTFVYVGGAFAQVSGHLRHNLARVDSVSGAVDAWDPCVGGPVDALCLFNNGQLLVQGLFWQAGGVDRQGLACLNLATGLPDPFVCDLTRGAGTASAKALTLSGGTLLVGGAFDQASGTARANLAALDAVSGAPLAWAPNPDGEVRALAVGNGDVYLGGAFANAGGAARAGLAAAALPGSGTATAFNPGCDGTVAALLLDAGNLYVGGSFGTLGGAARSNLGAVDALSGTALAYDPAPNSSVFALAGGAGALYVGGAFTQVGGFTRSRLARVNGDGTLDAAFAAQNMAGGING
ncbi:MAG TPA: delta-60 repeat domain-containing protein, partial [bacterium]|nr:delta-60 repeat domain-containing protein [bacterium]